MIVTKKKRVKVRAAKLGSNDPMINKLIGEGRIRLRPGGEYELLSREAVNGRSGRGQLAETGDFVLLDSSGYPYPNKAEYFRRNHIRLRGNEYEQIAKPLYAWTAREAKTDVIDYLLSNGILSINADDEQRYFSARLWGTVVSAPKDAVLIFYSIRRDGSGNIADVDFNFIIRDEFEIKYRICRRPLFRDGDPVILPAL